VATRKRVTRRGKICRIRGVLAIDRLLGGEIRAQEKHRQGARKLYGNRGAPPRNLNPAKDIRHQGTAHSTSWRGNFTVSVKTPNFFREFTIVHAVIISKLL
jgi:hypothetical protein